MSSDTRFGKKTLAVVGVTVLALVGASFVLETRNPAPTPSVANEANIEPTSAGRNSVDAAAVDATRPSALPAHVPSKPAYAVRSLDADFKRLKALSDAGDLDAARALVHALRQCKTSRSAGELAHRAQRHLASETDLDRRADLEQTLHFNAGMVAFCGDNAIDDIDELPAISRQLAEAGDSRERIAYLWNGQPQDTLAADNDAAWNAYRADAKRYLEEELTAGNDAALQALALGYQKSIVDGRSTPFQIDASMAYTYEYAYAMLNPPTINGVTIAPDGSRQIGSSLEGILTRLESQLTPEQIAAARAEAARLAQCCRR